MRNTARRPVRFLSEDLIPVTWIKQYHVCPRIVYFLSVLGATERTTESMLEGRIKHVKEGKLEERRKTIGGDRRTRVERRWTKLYIASKRLGLRGLVDEVADVKDGLTVVEVKNSEPPRKPPKHHLYQAVAYAMLAEEALMKPVRKIMFIYLPSGKKLTVQITEAMKRHVMWTIRRIRKIESESHIPPFKPKRICHGCGWHWICRKV